MDKLNYFSTPIWAEEKPEFVKSLNKTSDKYIKKNKIYSVMNNNKFLDFKNYAGVKSWQFLDEHGYDLNQYKIILSEMSVQEFSKDYRSAHINGNQHVSGFYFLKCNDKTSYPVFYEPKIGARTTKLKMKENLKDVVSGMEQICFKPIPGTLIIFPGYLEYEFPLGVKPFRFIHWNIQAIPKRMAKDD
tara:strand:+ start:269 stop:832 length:564 start_codon:yes stop_codon:yes gene_type:complete